MAFDGCVFDRRLILGGAGCAAMASLLRLDRCEAAAAPTVAAPAAPLVLAAAPAKLALKAGAETAVLAFDGTVPGPLIRFKLGGAVDALLRNGCDVPISLAWPGVRLSPATNGVVGLAASVKPGDSAAIRFTPPDAGFFWYRSDEADLAGRGLYGVLLVDEVAPPPVDADLLVVIDDWMLGPDGQISAGAAGAAGAAPLLTANSKPLPLLESVRPGARVRLRLLNACAARLAVVSCTGMAASVIGVDGQPSGLFEPARGTVPIGPGSRFELILDLPRDTKAQPAATVQMAAMPEQPLLRFALKGEPLPPRGPVLALPDNPRLPTRIHLESSLKRDLVISEGPSGKPAAAPSGPPRPLVWTMGGKPVDALAGKPLFTVKRDAPVTLAFSNRTDVAVQAHIRGHVVRVLHDLDDGWDPYWRDTVLVGPGRTKHVAFVADNPGRWLVEATALDRPGPRLSAFFVVD